MDSLDSEIIAWISKALVVKGGAGSGAQLGHAFNGNQYTTGSSGGSGEKREQAAAGGSPPPNEFSGNQYPKPNWGDKNLTPKSLKDVKVYEGETKTAAQIMEAVTRYADAHPDTMNGYSDKESHIKFIAEHEDAIPKWLVDKVTQKDMSVLEDNNYHAANSVIASQRPDLTGWTNKEKALAQWDTQKSAEIIQKGDTPGHPFRGNQYTEASADLAQRVENGGGRMKWAAQAAEHKGFADEHRAIARALTGAVNRGEIEQGRLPAVHEAIGDHLDAADAHDKAANEARALTSLDEGNGGKGTDKAADDYFGRLGDANRATDIAHEYTHLAFSLTPEELNKSTEITKGDLPGHEFRGNQYTEGSLSDTATRLASFVTKERTNIPPATAHDIADSHREHATLHRQAADQLRQHVDIMTSPENLHRDGEATASQVKATLAQAKEYTKAADLHDAASVAHQKAADTVLKSQGEYGGKLGLDEKAPTATQVSSASSNAAKASVAAENIVPFADANVQLPLGAPYYGG